MEQFTMAFPVNYAKIRNKVKCVYLIINSGGGNYSIVMCCYEHGGHSNIT